MADEIKDRDAMLRQLSRMTAERDELLARCERVESLNRKFGRQTDERVLAMQDKLDAETKQHAEVMARAQERFTSQTKTISDLQAENKRLAADLEHAEAQCRSLLARFDPELRAAALREKATELQRLQAAVGALEKEIASTSPV